MTNKTQIVISAKDETGAAINSARRGLDSLSVAGSKLGSAFGSIGVSGGLVGLLGGAGLAATVKEAVNGLDKLNDAAERVGISVEDLSALDFAGKMNGLEFEDMTQALTKLSVKMQEAASGSKEAGALFADLGIKVTDSSGKLKTADAVFSEIADAFSGMEDGAGKTALAVDAFGKSGAKLVPVLNGGAKGLADMRKEAESLGGIIDGKLAKQAADFNDSMDKLAILSASAGRSIASGLLPWLNEAAASFLIAQKHSDGLFDSLRLKMPGLQNVNPATELATVMGELEQIDFRLSNNRSKNQAEDQKQLANLERKAAYYRELVALKDKSEKPIADVGLKTPPKRTPTVSSGAKGSKQIDEALRLIQSLDEQIALKQADAESTDKMTQAEQQAIKVRYQLEVGTLKATDAQKQIINDRMAGLVALEKELAAQKEMTEAVTKQEEANVKGRQAMLDQIAAAEHATEIYNLTESQISVIEQARLADAIAIAKQNGASEEQIAYLEEELSLRSQLSNALITKDGKKNDIDEAKDKTEKAISSLDEFTLQAARNMQDAMADFFINPTENGVKGLADSFGQTLQKMMAQAAAAQIGKLLFGDLGSGKNGGDSGYIGAALNIAGSFFEDGGIMTKNGAVPLKKYAMGGIANSPQMAMFGEGSTPEAYVPLPDGRSIPVKMAGGGSATTIHVHVASGTPSDVKRAAGAGARSALGALSAAQRYA